MMPPNEIEYRIADYVRARSGYQPRRDYLSMSRIGDCSLRQYQYFVHGQAATEQIHRMAFIGYQFEAWLREILIAQGVARRVERELVADFDARLRGHIDGETIEGDLLEIKSTSRERFERMRGPRPEHLAQVKLYEHFGGYKSALLVYVCRDDFRSRVYRVAYSIERALELVDRAKAILQAIDLQQAPRCECGRCNNATN